MVLKLTTLITVVLLYNYLRTNEPYGIKLFDLVCSGGVGIAATQLCKTVENVTVFGTASASKHEAIQKLGVDYPIDYRTVDYAAEIRKVSPNGLLLCQSFLGI